MKILELTNYTAGGCGVGARVLRESKLLAEKGHKVVIFSTNREKGSGKLCPLYEKLEGIEIKRFPAVKLGGDSYMHWSFKDEAIAFKPDLIIAHSYRHLHTTKALKIAKKLSSKIFLVTHAPFARKKSRNLIGKIAVSFYDFLIGRNSLKKFDKVIAITHWEKKYLNELGLLNKDVEYIPNGVDKDFFKQIKFNNLNNEPKIIYLGRISPIKQIETLIEASSILGIGFHIVGPAEKVYLSNLLKKIRKLGSKSTIIDKYYTKSEQIRFLDSSDIFILPSKSEGLPQTLLEAMARGKIVIASDNQASRDIIDHQKNGFIYKNGDSKSLADLLVKVMSLSTSKINKIRNNARKTAEQFKWEDIIDKIEHLANYKNS